MTHGSFLYTQTDPDTLRPDVFGLSQYPTVSLQQPCHRSVPLLFLDETVSLTTKRSLYMLRFLKRNIFQFLLFHHSYTSSWRGSVKHRSFFREAYILHSLPSCIEIAECRDVSNLYHIVTDDPDTRSGIISTRSSICS